jgi:hypothetical protein
MNKKPSFIEIKNRRDVVQERRNFYCPEYENCLSSAAYQDLDFNCINCRLKDTKQNSFIIEQAIR